MHVTMIKKITVLFLTSLLLVALTGCEGATARDKGIREKFGAMIQEWNDTGTFPSTDPNVDTTKYLKEWEFRYSRLNVIYDSLTAHPVTARMLTESLALQWYNLYPENIKPRFELHVYAYKDMNSNDQEWGVTHIKKNGEVEAHWYTDVM